jgi:hypothetical protein
LKGGVAHQGQIRQDLKETCKVVLHGNRHKPGMKLSLRRSDGNRLADSTGVPGESTADLSASEEALRELENFGALEVVSHG